MPDFLFDLIRARWRFLLAIFLSCAFTPFFAWHYGSIIGFEKTIVLSFVVILLCVNWALQPDSIYGKSLLIIGFALMVVLCLSTTGKVIMNEYAETKDLALAEIDRVFLGTVLPDGQISFWLDKHELLNPSAIPGRILTEILQVAHASYYFFVYGFFLLLFIKFIFAKRGTDEERTRWVALQSVSTILAFGFIACYVGNILVPSVGPRLVFSHVYEHQFSGLLFAKPLMELITNSKMVLEDSFPSGYVAMFWLSAILAIRYLTGFGIASVICAALSTIGVIYLRYNYIVDVLAAFPVIVFALGMGGFFTSESKS